MICETIKKGNECFFMTKKGCNFNGGKCYPIVEHCAGCERIMENTSGQYCVSYPHPELKWRNGACNFSTHNKEEVKKGEKKLNALKASKRKAAGKI